ncbi:MAG: HAMP domain-containing protein [Bacteroidetes bacterium]|nr:HAMP domain-containing protein [Bacteroidota bacterium]
MQKKYLLLFVISILALLLAELLFSNRMISYDAKSDVEAFQNSFQKKEKIANDYLLETKNLIKDKGIEYLEEKEFLLYTEDFFQKNEIALFIANSNELLFWSNNYIPVSFKNLPNEIFGLDINKNGYYFFIQSEIEDITLWAYILLKKNYKYQNRFLKNKFQKDFTPSIDFKLSCNPALGFPVYNKNKNFAFSLSANNLNEKIESTSLWKLSLFLAILGFSLLVYTSTLLIRKSNLFEKRKSFFKAFAILLVLVLVRGIMFYFKIPEVVYQSKMFSAGLYASSAFLPSLGDLLLNALFFSVFILFLFNEFGNKIKLELKNYTNKILAVVSFFIILIIFNFSIIYIVNTLVINSQLQLNVNLINDVSIYNIIGLLVIGLLFFSLYFLSVFLLGVIVKTLDSIRVVLLLYLICIIVSIIVWKFLLIDVSFYWIPLCLIPFVIIFYKDNENNISKNFSAMVLTLFIFCLTITPALILFNKNKEIENRKTLALTLSLEQDPIAEYLFNELEDELFSDYKLINLVARDPYNLQNILGYLQKRYFNDYWNKYDLQLTVCAPGEKLIIRPSNIEVNCSNFFNEYINEFGKQTISNNLFFLDNNTGRSSYIAVVPVEVVFAKAWEVNKYFLFLEFDSKFIPRDLGFPELLIDEGVEFPGYLNIYSYSVYKNGTMSNKFGPFFYSINSSAYGNFEEEFTVFETDSFSHLHFNKDDETELIVSSPQDSVLELIAPFSYLFILFFAIIFIFWVLSGNAKAILLLRLNFKSRLQASMVGIVLVSLISVAAVSAWFIYNIYSNKNIDIINEKAYSVLTEIEHQMMQAPVLEKEFELYLNDVLLKLSNVFFTDINVYSPEGQLIGSSRNRVFEEGLISELMNPEAFLHLKGHKQILYVHNEKIGDLEYLSAYLPVRTSKNEILAYINLPYFAKHGELRNEITYFLVAFVNIYLLLLVLAIVIAILISGYVTRPLQMIRNSISSMKLGDENKKIDWNRNDEIGQLVQEYNRMIDELVDSAELLAQSERESAWREMAKQVAHEIKNPLTPMKLSVQYLEKAWKDKVPDWDERLKRFTVTMIEQIDSLSEIASAFSDFAKMPAGKFTELDLNKFVYEVVDLYKDFENVKIMINVDNSEKIVVFADKKQLLRVFNNLIKNAIQSYDKNKIAIIELTIYYQNEYCCVEVKDYGQGIKDDFKKNIFSPYFTTKTGGLGLGLAMVKNIIEGFGGSVAFTSTFGEGSTFLVKIPQLK